MRTGAARSSALMAWTDRSESAASTYSQNNATPWLLVVFQGNSRGSFALSVSSHQSGSVR